MAKDTKGKNVHQGRLGDAKEVVNQNRKPTAATKYYALRIQMPGGEEVTGLFTENQISQAIDRAKKNPEDIPKAGIFGGIQNALD